MEEQQECSICLEVLDGLIVKLSCKHIYHGECIEKWFNSSTNDTENICPECNEPSEIIEIFEIPMVEEDKSKCLNEKVTVKINNFNIPNTLVNNNRTYRSIPPNEISLHEDDDYSDCKKKCLRCTIL